MGLFGNGRPKLTYTPLRLPNATWMSLPDMGLIRNTAERKTVQTLAAIAVENVAKIEDANGLGSDKLRKLESGLNDLLRESNEDVEPCVASVMVGARLGYVVGLMENASGVERAEECESHYLTALSLAEHKFPKEVIGTLAFNFSEQAGYYLARTRDSELEMIMTIARSSDRTDWV